MVSMMSLSVSAQEKNAQEEMISLINVKSELGFDTAYYSYSEIEMLIDSSRVADYDDINLLLMYTEEYGLNRGDGFWYQSVVRYLEAPEKAAEADKSVSMYLKSMEDGVDMPDELGEYYFPNSVIYVPNSNYINCIMFDWSSNRFTIAIVAEDGLWILAEPEELDEDWDIFIDQFYEFILDHNW